MCAKQYAPMSLGPTQDLHGTYMYMYSLTAGEYEGFDEDQLTCQDGGKGLVMRDIKKKHH